MCSLRRSTAIEYWMRSLVPMLKKSTSLGEDVGGDRGAGNLDHRADFHLLVEGDALGAQFGAAFLEDDVGSAQFLHAGDHRIHDLHVARRRWRGGWRGAAS